MQFFLVHVVLVLADTDQLGVDLHQFGKRILQPACNADGGAGGTGRSGNSSRPTRDEE